MTKVNTSLCQTNSAIKVCYKCFSTSKFAFICVLTYQKPGMECDSECQIESREYKQSPESLQEYCHQTDLEHVGVEQHQQNNDQVKQDGNVLDTVKYKHKTNRKCKDSSNKKESSGNKRHYFKNPR